MSIDGRPTIRRFALPNVLGISDCKVLAVLMKTSVVELIVANVQRNNIRIHSYDPDQSHKAELKCLER